MAVSRHDDLVLGRFRKTCLLHGAIDTFAVMKICQRGTIGKLAVVLTLGKEKYMTRKIRNDFLIIKMA